MDVRFDVRRAQTLLDRSRAAINDARTAVGTHMGRSSDPYIALGDALRDLGELNGILPDSTL